MRLTASIPVVLALTASIWVVPARADDWDLCKDEKLALEQSIAACTRAINSKKYKARDLSTLYYNRAISYRQQGNNGQALADYNEAIRVDPRNEKPYNNRGNLYKDKGEADRAIADYSAAIRIKPDYVYALANRADIYDDKGDIDHAFADADQAIRVDSNYARAYNIRGLIW
jgi:tetratricopeptide (TPR) repeat protein